MLGEGRAGLSPHLYRPGKRRRFIAGLDEGVIVGLLLANMKAGKGSQGCC